MNIVPRREQESMAGQKIGSSKRPWSRSAKVALLSTVISAISVIIAAYVGRKQDIDQGGLVQIIERQDRTIEDLRGQVRANAGAIAGAKSEIERLASAMKKVDLQGIPTDVAPKPISSTAAKAAVTDHGFEFTLPICARTSLNAVSCELTITNLEPDRDLYLYSKSYPGPGSWLIDNFNNSYQAKQVALANRRGEEVGVLMVLGVRAKAVINFEGVDEQASQAAKLSLDLASSGGRFVSSFRNIELQ